jgi:serine/threonine-protein phosphatase 6 regulatory subunit 3
LKPETVEQLIKHIITEPPSDLEEKVRFKKAHVTCGLFAHDYNKIENVIVSNDHLMNQLLQFLQQPSPLHPLLASFFSKALTGCLQKYGSRTLKMFQQRSDFFDLLINHIDTSAIMDFIETFVTFIRQIDLDKADEQVSAPIRISLPFH